MNAIIQPHFDYTCSSWYPLLSKRISKRIQSAQNKCIRFYLDLKNTAHIGTDEIKSINWLPVRNRMEQNISSNVFKFFKCKVPAYYGEIFHTAKRGPVTRRSKFKLDFPFRNSNMGQKIMSFLGPNIWNALPTELKSMNNLNTF